MGFFLRHFILLAPPLSLDNAALENGPRFFGTECIPFFSRFLLYKKSTFLTWVLVFSGEIKFLRDAVYQKVGEKYSSPPRLIRGAKRATFIARRQHFSCSLLLKSTTFSVVLAL